MHLFQRLPLYVRPAPFLASVAALLTGIWNTIIVDWHPLGAGNGFLQVVLPTMPGHFLRPAWVALAALGVGGLIASTRRRLVDAPPARAWAWTGLDANVRIHPFTMVLALFLAVLGTAFILDATIHAEPVKGGVIALLFVDLDLLARPIMTMGGLLVTLVAARIGVAAVGHVNPVTLRAPRVPQERTLNRTPGT